MTIPGLLAKPAALVALGAVVTLLLFGVIFLLTRNHDAAPGGTSLTAHGKFIFTSSASNDCTDLNGTLLSATGDNGTIVGSQPINGSISPQGACSFDFSFPVRTTTTLTFRAGAYAVVGPDGHDGQVSASALSKPLVLYTL